MSTIRLRATTEELRNFGTGLLSAKFAGATTHDIGKISDQYVVISQSQASGADAIGVFLVYHNDTLSLIELPAESDNGYKRFWVRKEDILTS